MVNANSIVDAPEWFALKVFRLYGPSSRRTVALYAAVIHEFNQDPALPELLEYVAAEGSKQTCSKGTSCVVVVELQKRTRTKN